MQCNREAIRKRLKMGLVARVGSVKPLADDRPLAGVSKLRPNRDQCSSSGFGPAHRSVLLSLAQRELGVLRREVLLHLL